MKILSCAAIFLAVVFLGDRLVAFAAEKAIERSRNPFVRMYEGKYPADILLLGNSRVDRNISTDKVKELTGKTCLSLGLGGNHMLISEALLKDFVQRYGKPQLVVIEVSSSTVPTGSMGEMGIFSYCSPNMRALSKRVDPAYSAFESVFKSLQFNSPAFWRLSTEAFTEPPARLLQNTIPIEIIRQWENGGRAEMPVIGANLDALSSMCAYADAQSIRLSLVIGPYWNNFRKHIVNFEAWKARVQQAAGLHPIYDYSEVFLERNDFFNDEMHLNAVGANEFSKKLVADRVL